MQGTYSITDYGAVGDGTTDCSAAFEAAIAAMRTSDHRGATLLVPNGNWRISRPIVIDCGLILAGVSGSGWFAGSVIRPDDGVTGIVVQAYDDTSTGARGDWSVIRDLGLVAKGKTVPFANGIQMRARAKVENVWIRGFSEHGICINTALAPPTDLNANNWEVHFCRIELCGQHGMYLHGENSNAGLATGVDCSQNEGWGIRDDSFLGNCFVMCHVAENKQGPYGQTGNGASVFVGCYSESDQAPSDLRSPNTLVLGGDHGAGFSAQTQAVVLEPSYNSLRVNRAFRWALPDVTGVQVLGWVGVPGGTPYVLAFGSSDDEELGFHLQYASASGEWSLQYQGGGLSPFKLLALTNAKSGIPGQIAFPSLWLGDGNLRRRHVSGDGPPATGNWTQGDVVHNAFPQAGGFCGWICVSGGTPGVWKGFGLIKE
jgi:hypothetical protein